MSDVLWVCVDGVTRPATPAEKSQYEAELPSLLEQNAEVNP